MYKRTKKKKENSTYKKIFQRNKNKEIAKKKLLKLKSLVFIFII